MKFYGIDAKGSIEVQEVNELPVWDTSYESRILYLTSDKLLYYGTDSGWEVVGNVEIDASKIVSGVIGAQFLPTGAVSQLYMVADETARFALTSPPVNVGDTVKQEDTGTLYYVVDTDNLDNEAGYTSYTAAIDWSLITNKPNFPTTPLTITEATGNTVTTTTHTHAIGSSSMGYGKRTVSTSDPSGGNDGDVWFKYT